MAAQTGANFENTFNNVTTGLFKDNTIKAILASFSRTLVTAIKESYLNRLDDAVFNTLTVSTTGGTITLDFSAATTSMLNRLMLFIGSSTFAGPKTIALSNSTNARIFEFIFEITNVAAVLTFPSGFKMDDVRWDSLTWTPVSTGKYKAKAVFDGTDWLMEISQNGYV